MTPRSLPSPADPAARPGPARAPRREPIAGRPRRGARKPREGPRLEPIPGRPRRARRGAPRGRPRWRRPRPTPPWPSRTRELQRWPVPWTPFARRGGDPRSAAPVTRRATPRTRPTRHVDDPDDPFRPPKAEPVAVHRPAPRRPARGGYPEINREPPLAASAGCGYHLAIGDRTGSLDGRVEVALTPGATVVGGGSPPRPPRRRPAATAASASARRTASAGTARCRSGPGRPGADPEHLRSSYNIPAPNVGAPTPGTPRTPPPRPGKHSPARAILGALRRGPAVEASPGPGRRAWRSHGQAEFNPGWSPPASPRL